MAARDVLREWLTAEIDPFMRERGWSRSASSYLLRRPGVVGVIAFRAHPESDATLVAFWVSVGVWSSRLAEVEAILDDGLRRPKPPSFAGCHWQLAYSDVMEPELKAWTRDRPSMDWLLDRSATPETWTELTAIVRDRLDHVAIPAATTMTSEEALRDAYLAGYMPVSSSRHRIPFTWVLVQALGPAEELPRLRAEMRSTEPAFADALGL
jgi:hypothetical protein